MVKTFFKAILKYLISIQKSGWLKPPQPPRLRAPESTQFILKERTAKWSVLFAILHHDIHVFLRKCEDTWLSCAITSKYFIMETTCSVKPQNKELTRVLLARKLVPFFNCACLHPPCSWRVCSLNSKKTGTIPANFFLKPAWRLTHVGQITGHPSPP